MTTQTCLTLTTRLGHEGKKPSIFDSVLNKAHNQPVHCSDACGLSRTCNCVYQCGRRCAGSALLAACSVCDSIPGLACIPQCFIMCWWARHTSVFHHVLVGQTSDMLVHSILSACSATLTSVSLPVAVTSSSREHAFYYDSTPPSLGSVAHLRV
jgi:hypothetical protein